MVIPIAHDFTCPWCWIGFHQVMDLEREFGVTFEWRAYELFPEALGLPEPTSIPVVPTNRPKTPSRLSLAYAAQGMSRPDPRTEVSTHGAHQAMELAKEFSKERALAERMYRAFWEQGADISRIDVLAEIARGLLDENELRETIAMRRFSDRITQFDSAAYASGVFNVPTFWIGGERHAEQPLPVLRAAISEVLTVG